MTEDLIEELARQLETVAHHNDRNLSAQAILPIIQRREIEAGEKVKDAAANCGPHYGGGSEDFDGYDDALDDYCNAIRALDVAAILKKQGDD